MDLIGDFKAGINAAMHPSSNTQNMSLGQAIGFYYRASVLPGIIALIIDGIIGFVLSPSEGVLALATIVGSLWIALPLGIIIDAAIYQFFDKMLFGIFNEDISKTATATMFAEMPVLALAFLYFLPSVGALTYLKDVFGIIIGIWGIIVLTISFREQQKISTGKAILAWLLPGIILGVIFAIIILVMAFALGAVSPVGIPGTSILP
ncbi:multipass membrane protein [Candidatus Mancarchaeum acidiphilum]|uniref:Multipass membrane protein n=1 Tax=Candidatus Mancarchaeum acidiphilum TaxID=1920749 RepID=A0A218NP93_9ARCH|nr:hypothetical protein [Candidatus Mancarchaeum acidiphilum]ASI14281.1 multipass membrane protein [Candidatus Mancarchaeum acidiphilum]